MRTWGAGVGLLQKGRPLSVNGKEIDKKGVKWFGVQPSEGSCPCGSLVSEVKSDSPSILTREETDGLDSLTFENVGARFFASLLDQISLQLFWSFSSFSLGLVAFLAYIVFMLSFSIQDLNWTFFIWILCLKKTFSMLWNKLCGMEIICFYFLFVSLFLWVNYKSEYS